MGYTSDQYILGHLFSEGTVIPFIGAGLSKDRGLLGWGDLIDVVAQRLGVQNQIKAANDLLQAAEYLTHLAPNGLLDIVTTIEDIFRERLLPVEESDAHLLLAALNPPVIYTTNYDSLIEDTYAYLKRAFHRIVTLEDIVAAHKTGATQIVKFHGDFSRPESIVLTETAYFRRFDFETPLDIKLRSDILGQNVLFLGYSFSDMNIRYMFYRLRQLMSRESGNTPKAYIVLPTHNPVSDRVLKSIGVRPIYLSEYPGEGTSGKLISLLQGIMEIAAVESDRIQPIVTKFSIQSLRWAIENEEEEAIRLIVANLKGAEFPSHQLDLLAPSDDDGFAWWWAIVASAKVEVRESLMKLLLGLQQDIPWLSALRFLAFLRYPEVRWLESEAGYPDLWPQPPFSKRMISILVSDAVFWAKNGPLERDTTLYYIVSLCECLEDEEELKTALNLFYEREPGLPSPDWLQENTEHLDRICDSYGYWVHRPGEFHWPTYTDPA